NTIIELNEERRHRPIAWYYAPTYLLFWLALFFAVVVPLFNHLPTGVREFEEPAKPGEFVAERAQRVLLELDRMGPKIVGDEMNEKTMVEFMLNEIEKVRQVMRYDLYELEVDLQRASGAYLLGQMINMYQAIQNVVVKVSTKSSNSTNYLLINSHYDTKQGSTGTGDAGFMIVVMLEVMRQLVTSEQTFEHPVVFLYNGAEEQPLQGSHAFITKHKWSTNCRALINLDSCGAGGREILFQSGPNHPWLMHYYRLNAKHPFASTMAEELFQAGFISSDTDFRIFRDFGPVPGVDMANTKNGFVYHSKFDRYDVISRDSLQNTGENVLALARGISNAPEMYDTDAHAEGHSVFFDFLGLFFIYYVEITGIALNISFALAGLAMVCVSLWRMTKVTGLESSFIASSFGVILLLELAGFALALLLPLLMAALLDAGDRSMAYFANSWLVLGLYICPSIIGLMLPVTLYYTLQPSKRLPHRYHLQMAGQAHCVILSLLCLILTAFGIRSAYLLLMSLFFFVGALLLNILTNLQDRGKFYFVFAAISFVNSKIFTGYHWCILICVSQLLPFLYFSYLFHAFITVLIPRSAFGGGQSNPDLLIALLCGLGTILSMGFVAPLINIFWRPKCIIFGLGLITFIFSMISISSVGFPYRPKTNVMRITFLEVQRTFYEYDGYISLHDSGYYFDIQDRHQLEPISSSVDVTDAVPLDCGSELMCGVPCLHPRWCKTAAKTARWLPRQQHVEIPGETTLKCLNKTELSGYRIKYGFRLSGPPHIGIFLRPVKGAKMLDWSFVRGMLDKPFVYKPPYHIFYTWAADNSPLEFSLELLKTDGYFEEPVLEIGIAAHYVSHEHKRDALSKEFIQAMPDFVYVMEWPASYTRYVF
ncbi:CG13160, partial [Drosophila busckii]